MFAGSVPSVFRFYSFDLKRLFKGRRRNKRTKNKHLPKKQAKLWRGMTRLCILYYVMTLTLSAAF